MSHAQTGTARTSANAPAAGRRARAAATLLAKADLAQAPAELRGFWALGSDSDLGGRRGHVPQDRVADSVTAGRVLDRSRVGVGDASEVVLGLDEPPCGRTHLPAQGFAGQTFEGRSEHLGLALVRGHLDGRLVRQLRE